MLRRSQPAFRPAFPGAGLRLAAALCLGSLVHACGQTATRPRTGQLTVVSGTGQIGLAGVPLPESLTVRLVDAEGQPLSGRTVRWSGAGSDSLTETSTTTDRDGMARTLWVLGLVPGPDTVLATAGDDSVRFVGRAELAEPGARYTGRRAYISYVPGGLPLILSAPHGGTAEPSEIPDRTTGTTVRDLNTDLLAAELADALERRLGTRPHLVIDHLHRRKMDANRALTDATDGNPLAEHAWLEFQTFLEHARRSVTDQWGQGLFIDLHGHGHEILRLELGYLLTADDLALPDARLDDPSFVASSSLRHLAGIAAVSFPELIRGPTSFGALFGDEGVPAVPSPAQPDPGNEPFFSGGYNTARHGSRDGGVIDGIQIEAHRVGVRDTPENRARFAAAAAAVLQRFLETHYGLVLTSSGDPAPGYSSAASSTRRKSSMGSAP